MPDSLMPDEGEVQSGLEDKDDDKIDFWISSSDEEEYLSSDEDEEL